MAGVEISTDGGKTWHPATGTTNWTYSGTPTEIRRRYCGLAPLTTAATSNPPSPESEEYFVPVFLVGVNIAPAAVDSGDGSGDRSRREVLLGCHRNYRRHAVLQIREEHRHPCWKVWNMAGQRLATVTFTGESASGWQTDTLSPALAVTANTMYMVSYFAPAGHYSQDKGFFYNHPSPPPEGNGSTDSAPLHFTRSLPGNHNGFYRYGRSSTFPDRIYAAEYYWVDVVLPPVAPPPSSVTPLFSPPALPFPAPPPASPSCPAPAPAVSSVFPANSATGVDVGVKPAATFNQAVTGRRWRSPSRMRQCRWLGRVPTIRPAARYVHPR